jgi:hypothetical protein
MAAVVIIEDTDDDDRQDLPDVMETIERAGKGASVTVREMMDSVGAKAYGPLLIVPGLISLLPVPGSGIAAGILAILVALQIVLARGRMWLPAFLADRSVPRDRLMRFLDRMEPWAHRASRFVAPRLEVLTEPPLVLLVAVVALAMGALMFPLTVLFYAVAIPGLVLIVIGLALTAADGIALIVGYGLAVGAVALAIWLLV